MRIEFDPAKRDRTRAERGLDFADAPVVFAQQSVTIADLRFDYPEPRFQTFGWLEGGSVGQSGVDANPRRPAHYFDEEGQ